MYKVVFADSNSLNYSAEFFSLPRIGEEVQYSDSQIHIIGTVNRVVHHQLNMGTPEIQIFLDPVQTWNRAIKTVEIVEQVT